MALLFAADRMDHLQNSILPSLKKGLVVIADRYYLSEFAYQSGQLDMDWLREINSRCRKPDLTVFLDVPVERSLDRRKLDVWRSHDRHQLFEDREMLHAVRQRYLDIIPELAAEGEQIAVVKGSRSINEVHKRIISAVEPLLRPRRSPRQGRNSASAASREIASMLGVRRARRK